MYKRQLQVGWGFGDDGLIPEVRDGVTTSPGLACEADLSVMLGEEVLFVEEGSTSGYLYPSLQLKKAGIDYTSDITQRFAVHMMVLLLVFITVMLNLVLHLMTQEEH